MFTSTRIRNFVRCGIGGLVLFFAATPALAQAPKALTLSAGAIGQTWYMLAAYLGEDLKKSFPDTQVTVMGGGGVANINLLSQGTVDFGMTSTDLYYAALKGRKPYKKAHTDILAVANIEALSAFYFMVDASKNLKSIPEFVQKKTPLRICTFKKTGPPAVSALRLFAEMGVSEKDIVDWGGKINFMSWQDCVSLFRDGHVDAMVGGTGLPSPFHAEVASIRKVDLLPVPGDVVQKLVDKYGYIRVTIPKGTYGVAKEDIPVFGWTGYILTRSQTPDKVVYDLTKLMYENAAHIRQLHKAFRNFNPKQMHTDIPGPLHPGAARFYREKGLIK